MRKDLARECSDNKGFVDMAMIETAMRALVNKRRRDIIESVNDKIKTRLGHTERRSKRNTDAKLANIEQAASSQSSEHTRQQFFGGEGIKIDSVVLVLFALIGAIQFLHLWMYA